MFGCPRFPQAHRGFESSGAGGIQPEFGHEAWLFDAEDGGDRPALAAFPDSHAILVVDGIALVDVPQRPFPWRLGWRYEPYMGLLGMLE